MDPNLGLALVIVFCALLVAWMIRRRKVTMVHPSSGRSGNGMEIVCLQGPLQGRRYQFHHGLITIGRQKSNNIVLSGSLVSRQHARLETKPNGVFLYDMDSTNGVWVMGQRVDAIELFDNQPFQIGPTVFMLSRVGQRHEPIAAPSTATAERMISPSILGSMDIRNYERLKVIGEGGAATVYLYRARGRNEYVAVKVLLYSVDPYFKRKFLQEGQFGLELQQPQIVRTLGKGESNGLSYIIMEYMPAGSLRDRMVRGPVPLEASIQVVGQMCLALDYAHRKKIYHRDIKPENILFSNENTAKLADFGIARFTRMRTVTQEGMLVGTPEYMSYEQARGTDIDGRSDQYSLGIVLYEMLTCSRPFDGDALSIVGQHLNKKPQPPRQINSNIPVHVERVIMKALDKNKNRRYASILDMGRALGFNPESLPQQQPVAGSGPRQAEPVAQPHFRFSLINTETNYELQLTQPITVLGRKNLHSQYVSQNHAKITVQGSEVYISDLNSRNGTFVNQKPVYGQARLAPGCVVRLGPVSFRFQTR